MFHPLECFIALRYLRAGRHRGFASFITVASVFGMALGVAALIVVLSVMNGLETELRTRLLSMTAHATLANPREGVSDWRALKAQVVQRPGVVGVSPYVLVEGMLGSGSNLSPAIVRGILPEEEMAVSRLGDFLRAGRLDDLEAGERRIILGRILALNLGVGVGDRVNLLIPEVRNGRPAASLRSFRVSGIFAAGIQQHDAGLALIHLGDASELRGFAGRAGGIAVRLRDPLAVRGFPALARWDSVLWKHSRLIIPLALVPTSLDWLLGVLGVWPNTPLSRLATGGLLGLVAGYYLARAMGQVFVSNPPLAEKGRALVIGERKAS